MNLRLLCCAFIILSFSGMSHAMAQGWLWAKSAGGTGNENATAVATDTAGNIYVTGTFSSATVTFGSVTLTNTASGFRDIFLVKYAPSGSVLWATSAGGSSDDYATTLSLDAWGNICLGGYFYSPSIAFGTTTLTNYIDSATCDFFVTKFNSSGAVVWAKGAGGRLNDQVSSIKTDATGAILLTGYFESQYLIFGIDTVKNPVPLAADVFVIKYDSSGNFIWGNNSGGFGDNYGNAITTDASNNVFVAGVFNSPTITFGDSVLTNSGTGTDDIFLVKYNRSGALLWARQATGSNDDVANALATDASGNVYCAGAFASTTLSFSTNVVTNTGGGYDAFVAKYNTSGSPLWATSIGTVTDNTYSYLLTLDAASNIIVAGNFGSSSVSFGSSTLTNDVPGTYDLFIAKYNSSGTALWANSNGGGGAIAGGVATDAAGDIYLAGNFSDSAFSFGENVLLNSSAHTGTTDMFLAKYILTSLSIANVSSQASKIVLYPNPAEDKINVVLNGAGYNSLSVYDCTGRSVYQKQLAGNEQIVEVNISNLTDGVYFVRAMQGDNMANATFVIRK